MADDSGAVPEAPANVGELHECGSSLLSDAAAALDNESLTSNRYQPAIDNWDGMCAPELADARSPILTRADESHNALAWAAVVTQYWADRVIRFNAEVDQIRAEIGTDGTQNIADGAMEVWDNAGEIGESIGGAVSSGVDTVKGWFS